MPLLELYSGGGQSKVVFKPGSSAMKETLNARCGFVTVVLLLILPGSPCLSRPPVPQTQPAGIAAKYPGDKGIATDPAAKAHMRTLMDKVLLDG